MKKFPNEPIFTEMNTVWHGVGRAMSRKAANEKFNWKDVNRFLRERGVTLISAGLDEVPMAYKNIREVVAAQHDLVTVLGQFDPKLVKMASSGERRTIEGRWKYTEHNRLQWNREAEHPASSALCTTFIRCASQRSVPSTILGITLAPVCRIIRRHDSHGVSDTVATHVAGRQCGRSVVYPNG